MISMYRTRTSSKLKLNYEPLTRLYSQKSHVNLAFDLYDKYKSDKSLVIAHGLFASKYSWRSVAKALNERIKHKVYTVDLRNHADSVPYTNEMSYTHMAHDLKEFIQNTVIPNQNTNEVFGLGHSMGGKAFMTLALVHPNLITKLIVSDVSPNHSPSTEVIRSILATIKDVDLSKFSDVYVARKAVDKALIENSLLNDDAMMRAFILTRLATNESGQVKWQFSINSIFENIRNIMEFPNLNSHFTKETLFLAGEKSNYITEKDEADIQRYFDNYKIIHVKNAGHVIHLDNPTDTIKYVNEFLP